VAKKKPKTATRTASRTAKRGSPPAKRASKPKPAPGAKSRHGATNAKLPARSTAVGAKAPAANRGKMEQIKGKAKGAAGQAASSATAARDHHKGAKGVPSTATNAQPKGKTNQTGRVRPSGKKLSLTPATAGPVIPVADAQGYAMLNGRRVRVISTKGRTIAATRRARLRNKEAAARSAAQAAEAVKQPKLKLPRKELDQYRQLLLQKRAQLQGDLRAMEAEALQPGGGDLSHMPIHMADIGTDTYDQDFMLRMAGSERELLREIDAALQRVEDGSYGVCQTTGKLIPKARLDAKPWARYTIEAARDAERGKGV
jgi:RNA polymerase-binding protein DksA